MEIGIALKWREILTGRDGETSTWLFPPAPLFRPFDDVSDTIKDAPIIPGVAINRAPSQPAAPVAPKPAPKPTPKPAPKPGVKTHPKVAPKIPTKPKLPQNRPKVSARQVVSRWVKSAYKRVRGGGKGSSARKPRIL
jgi:outer membrane biosynthesis protein TonB